MTELPDGSGCCTVTVMSHEEASALPQAERPLNYRLPGDVYHAVFETVGHASMCWIGGTGHLVFDSAEAEKAAVGLCFKIADAMDKQTSLLSEALRAICLTRDYVGPGSLPAFDSWEWYSAGKAIAEAIPNDEWAKQFWLRVNADK
jgi:hypothetical protein